MNLIFYNKCLADSRSCVEVEKKKLSSTIPMSMRVSSNSIDQFLSSGARCLIYADPERETGGADPPEKSQSIEFSSNTAPDIMTNLQSQHSMLGHHPQASEKPFKWHFAGRPMMARL